jgi:membrane protease subunit (stomatin/prohibitin family)
MGLFDFIKSELIEVIDWVESDNDTVIWKFPHEGNNIKKKTEHSLLYVNHRQQCCLMKVDLLIYMNQVDMS